jgi:hypothetical protein
MSNPIEDAVRELEKVANDVALYVRTATDNPRIGIAALMAAGMYWAQKCGLSRADLDGLIQISLDKFYPSQNDLDTPRKDH